MEKDIQEVQLPGAVRFGSTVGSVAAPGEFAVGNVGKIVSGVGAIGAVVGQVVSQVRDDDHVQESNQSLSSSSGEARTGAQFTFVDELMEPGKGPVLSPGLYIKRMNLDILSFAQNARVHRNTVSRAPEAASVQKHLRENVKVLKAAFDASGGDLGKAIHWFRNEPLAPFGYKTAEEIVADGRTQDVLRLIESYSAGAAG